jgi:hypothetical protein
MHHSNTTHDNTSDERHDSRPGDGPDGPDASAHYQGRHVRLDLPDADAEVQDQGSPLRRRGFRILSRLARVDSDPAADSAAVPAGAHAALVDA